MGSTTRTTTTASSNQASFTDNPRVTAYIDGKLVWGTEPGPVPRVESVEVQYANLDLDPNSTDPNIKLQHEGPQHRDRATIAAGRLTVRYWFTRDGGTSPLQSHCDYAEHRVLQVPHGASGAPSRPVRPLTAT